MGAREDAHRGPPGPAAPAQCSICGTFSDLLFAQASGTGLGYRPRVQASGTGLGGVQIIPHRSAPWAPGGGSDHSATAGLPPDRRVRPAVQPHRPDKCTDQAPQNARAGLPPRSVRAFVSDGAAKHGAAKHGVTKLWGSACSLRFRAEAQAVIRGTGLQHAGGARHAPL